MARIAGVNIPTQKKLGVALTYVYGIGDKISKDVCSQANVDANTRVQDLSEAEIKNVSDVISSSFLVEGDLRRVSSLSSDLPSSLALDNILSFKCFASTSN